MSIFKRISSSTVQRGWTRSVQSVASVLEDYYFDRKYGLNTVKIVEIGDLDISSADKQHSFRYQPTRRRHFGRLMNNLDFPSDSVFVDMGSGKGRVLLMATEYDFKRIVGVEISPGVCAVARQNVATFESKANLRLPIEIVESDALNYRFSDDENVFYFFKPFSSHIVQEVLANIKASLARRRRKTWLIFNNFRYQELFDREKQFQRSLDFAYGGASFVVFTADTASTPRSRT